MQYVSGKSKQKGNTFQRIKPRYLPVFWFTEQNVLNEMSRTFSWIEVWHSKFNNLFKGQSNFKFYAGVEALRSGEHISICRQKTRYEQNSQRLRHRTACVGHKRELSPVRPWRNMSLELWSGHNSWYLICSSFIDMFFIFEFMEIETSQGMFWTKNVNVAKEGLVELVPGALEWPNLFIHWFFFIYWQVFEFMRMGPGVVKSVDI